MKLSVIIPVYQEPVWMIKRAVRSVKAQYAYTPEDVEILLCSDSPGRDDLDLDGCTVIDTVENTGPGLARQRGIDAASGDYILFLDADDIFYNLLAFGLIFADMGRDPVPDIVRFPILEEREDGTYAAHGQDSTWCFSKAFRRGFLTEHSVRFAQYRAHEDAYFVRLAELYHPNIIEHGDMICLWTNNPASTVRRENGIYWQTSFPDYIDVIYRIIAKKGELGADNTQDHIYNICYCYAIISRMYEEHEGPAIEALKRYVDASDIVLFQALHKKCASVLREIETLPNLPVRLCRYSFQAFLEKLR